MQNPEIYKNATENLLNQFNLGKIEKESIVHLVNKIRNRAPFVYGKKERCSNYAKVILDTLKFWSARDKIK